jgi:hypothetical protein
MAQQEWARADAAAAQRSRDALDLAKLGADSLQNMQSNRLKREEMTLRREESQLNQIIQERKLAQADRGLALDEAKLAVSNQQFGIGAKIDFARIDATNRGTAVQEAQEKRMNRLFEEVTLPQARAGLEINEAKNRLDAERNSFDAARINAAEQDLKSIDLTAKAAQSSLGLITKPYDDEVTMYKDHASSLKELVGTLPKVARPAGGGGGGGGFSFTDSDDKPSASPRTGNAGAKTPTTGVVPAGAPVKTDSEERPVTNAYHDPVMFNKLSNLQLSALGMQTSATEARAAATRLALEVGKLSGNDRKALEAKIAAHNLLRETYSKNFDQVRNDMHRFDPSKPVAGVDGKGAEKNGNLELPKKEGDEPVADVYAPDEP